MNLYKKHLNGILADETGLGKTVQIVAYMAHLAGQEGTSLFKHTHECVIMNSSVLIFFKVDCHEDIVCFCPQASGGPTLL